MNYKNLVIIASDPYLYIVNSKTGSTIFKIAISSINKPIVAEDNLFLITKDNLIVCFDLKEAKIIYSLDIGNEIANFLKTKQKQININHVYLLNSSLFVFLNNSYLVKFDLNGSIIDIDKLKTKMVTNPIFINQSILYLDNNNKLVILN
jgi:outer membrane protein assembly factor BamB